MDPLVKKVFFILLILLIIIGLVIAIPYIYVSEGPEAYPWLKLGTDSIIKLLWDAQARKFKEMPVNSTAYWVDDQAKMLWLMIEDPITYNSYITDTLNNLLSVYHNGYFPRRWVVINPQIISNDTSNVDIRNGFLEITGDLTGEDPANPLRIRYYEAAGFSDMAYLGGQSFIVDRQDQDYFMITYDPIHLRAEECQNPGFDVWNPTWSNDSMLLPWAYSYPQNWFYSDAPPFGCTYSTRWVHEKPHNGRCIGFENFTIGERDWRSTEFEVNANTSYVFSFLYRGNYISGGTFKAFLRWFDASHDFLSQDYAEFNSSVTSWNAFSHSYTSPANAMYADVVFWAESNSNGNYYFDTVKVGNCTILNPNFDTADHLPFSTSTCHSTSQHMGRAAQFYNSYDYIVQWLPVTISVSRLYNFTFWAKSAIPTTYLNFTVFYNDGTYTELSKAITSSNWSIYSVMPTELSSGKTIVAFGFKTGTASIDTYVDDVAVHYMPDGAVKTFTVEHQKDAHGNTNYTYVGTLLCYEDNDMQLTIRYGFNNNTNYIEQKMSYNQKGTYHPTTIYYQSALDGLSTVTSGVGTQKTAYSSVWIPEVGRKEHNEGSYVTNLIDREDMQGWNMEHPYFIVELKQIPEWAGCYGIAVKLPLDHFVAMQNSNSNATSPYLHYLTYSCSYQPLFSSQKCTFQIYCFNGYDFTNPTIYDYYLMNPTDFYNVDLSMCYHIGTIIDALAQYYRVKNDDPYGMGMGAWTYYRNVFESHNNGSYLLTTGKAIEASMTYYSMTGELKYLDFAEYLANYLASLQIKSGVRAGTFPMKHNDVAYLDCQAACLIGLKLMFGYNISYSGAYDLGLRAIHYDYEPVGYNIIIDPTDYGVTIDNIKRLYVYANTTYIDDDFFTFKSAYTARACLGVNDSFAMLALSRVWRNIVWNATDLSVYVCESIPGRTYAGTRIDWISTNSETQPYGLMAWLEIAKYHLTNYQYYYKFLAKHYAIENLTITKASLNVNITGQEGYGTLSTFYLKGLKTHAEPATIKVNGATISSFGNLDSLYVTNRNSYYYDSANYTLTVKAFIVNGTTNLEIQWIQQPYDVWVSMMLTLGIMIIAIVAVFVLVHKLYLRNKMKRNQGEIIGTMSDT